MKNKTVLVTGADGFIGSHLVEELVRRGFNVRAFVMYNSFNSWGWLDSSPQDIKTAIDIFSGDILFAAPVGHARTHAGPPSWPLHKSHLTAFFCASGSYSGALSPGALPIPKNNHIKFAPF